MKRFRLITDYWLLITLAFLAHTLFYFFALGTDAVDDAYISFRYAQNAIRGAGLFFNPGERVEGFTNFLWTTLMIPLEGARVDVGRASMVLGVLFALATLWLVVRFARTVGAPRGAGWLAALLLAVDGSFALWAVAGLETALFAFLVFAGALLYVQEQKWDTDREAHRRTQMSLRAERSNLQISEEIASSHPSTPLRSAQGRSGSLLAMTQNDPRLSAWLWRTSPQSVRVQSDFPFSGIFFALAAMTRPEGLMVFAITVAHQAAWRVLAERRLFTRRDLTRVAAFGALFAPYWLGRWWYYKSFLPNSFYAKVSAAGPAAQIERGWNYLNQFVGVHIGWIIALPALVALLVSLRAPKGRSNLQTTNEIASSSSFDSAESTLSNTEGLRSHLPWRAVPGGSLFAMTNPLFWTTYLTAIIIPYAAYIVYVGGDWSVGRFFVPLLAPFYLLFSTGIVDMWQWIVDKLPRGWGKGVKSAAIAGTILLGALLFESSSRNGEYGIYVRGFDAANATLARETMGRWLRANVPRGTLIAVDAAGQVPYFSELPAIDMFGINDLHIGRLNVATLGEGTPGHEKFDLGYVIAREPKYVVIFGTLLDSVMEYERAPVTWTNNPALQKFLTLYRRRGTQ